MTAINWLRLVVLSIVWGLSFVLVEVALTGAPPLVVVLARVGFAALALLIYCAIAGIRITLSGRLTGLFIALGFANNVVPFCLITYGQTQITGSLAAILNATTPLFTVVIAHFWGRVETATAPKLAGVLTGVAGVAVLMGLDTDVTGAARSSGALLGQLAVLGAAFAYGVAAVLGKRLSGHPPVAVATGMLCASTVMLTPIVLYLAPESFTRPVTGDALAAMIGLALISTAFAYLLYFRILASAGATNAMLVTFLIPVTAIALGVATLGEPLEAHHLAGLALILAGLALVDGRVLALGRGKQRREEFDTGG